MKIIVLLAAISPLLAACQTTPAARLAANQTACSGYGFRAETDAYAACMMQRDRDDTAEARRQSVEIGEAFSEMGQTMQRKRAVTCDTYETTDWYGNPTYGKTTTTCY